MSKPPAEQTAPRTTEGRSIDWAAIVPKNVGYEDTMSDREVAAMWEKMMRAAKLRAPNEVQRASFRLAVYVYGVHNGTSREGNYAGVIEMADGTSFDASVIHQTVGKFHIRRFFRGNMMDSYEALKESGAILNDERMVAKAAALGIAAEQAFAMADWMSNCPRFTPVETVAHEQALNFALSRARRARGGRNLEDVEGGRQEKKLQVQGKPDEGISLSDF